ALMGFWGMGRLMRTKLLPGLIDDSLTALYDFAIGCWLAWLAIFFLGLLAGIRRGPAWALLIITAAAGFWFCYQKLFQTPGLAWARIRPAGLTRKNIFNYFFIVISALIILMALVGALTPPAAQDALVHHLAI